MTFLIAVGVIVAIVLAAVLAQRAADHRELKKHLWTGALPHPTPVLFLNGGMAIRPTVMGQAVPEGYRYACRFFGVGLIDRTGTLDHGFKPEIIDPIPSDLSDVPDMAQLCAQRAAELVRESRERDVPIRLLWSGGIDSTCVAATLLTALGDDTNRLEIAYSKDSVSEYRKFYWLLKKRGIRLTEMKAVSEALDGTALIVTGEHGDQIFGSMLAANLPFPLLKTPWRDTMPAHIEQKIGAKGRDKMLSYLAPQIAVCPVSIETTYDFLWWANFSMKWQTVSQRVLATLDTAERRTVVAPMLRHFFRTDDFQRWAMTNPNKKIRDDWPSYKYPLKDIIFEFNGDKRYRKHKIKERSLRGLTGRLARRAVAIDAAGGLYTQPLDRSIIPLGERWTAEFSYDWE